MSEQKPDSSKSKVSPFVRKKLTPFLAHEMLYDFANGTLEPERRIALEEFLKKDQESQLLLRNIESAQAYVKKLKGLQVDSVILSQLLEAESAISLGRKYSSWKEWPETIRWSLTAIVLSAVVAGSVAIVPWSKLTSKKSVNGPESVEVAQIPQPKSDDAETVAANEDNGSGDEAPEDIASDEGSGDDVADSGSGDDEGGGGGAQSAAKVAGLAAAPTPKPTPAPKTPELLGKSMPAPMVAVHLPPPASTTASGAAPIGVTPDTHESHDAKAKGFVYRAFMNLDNLEELGPKIRDEIIALGGEKAGEVELGWKRGNGRYYHFTLPESNEKKILERLQVYGPVRISKDPHPRVMPPGQVRFILWVDSAGSSN